MQVDIYAMGRGRRRVLGGIGTGRGAHPHRRWHREGHQAGGRASTVRSRADKPVGLGEGQDPWKCWVSGLQGPTAQKEKNWAS